MLVWHPLVTQGAAGPPRTAQGTDAKRRTAEGAPWGSSFVGQHNCIASTEQGQDPASYLQE